mmetsp:Transcript_46025/g.89905  ORF Transcript_46025/g.89905 Transcript_46025/m.89905 type:complete len:324 (-) Transcript_46025:434-1405(-)
MWSEPKDNNNQKNGVQGNKSHPTACSRSHSAGQPHARGGREAVDVVKYDPVDGGAGLENESGPDEPDAGGHGGRYPRGVPFLRAAFEGELGAQGEAARAEGDEGHGTDARRPLAADALVSDGRAHEYGKEQRLGHAALARGQVKEIRGALVEAGVGVVVRVFVLFLHGERSGAIFIFVFLCKNSRGGRCRLRTLHRRRRPSALPHQLRLLAIRPTASAGRSVRVDASGHVRIISGASTTGGTVGGCHPGRIDDGTPLAAALRHGAIVGTPGPPLPGQDETFSEEHDRGHDAKNDPEGTHEQRRAIDPDRNPPGDAGGVVFYPF